MRQLHTRFIRVVTVGLLVHAPAACPPAWSRFIRSVLV